MAPGYTAHACAKCGDTYTDARVNALGHEWVPNGDATHKCSRNCGAVPRNHAMAGPVREGDWNVYACGVCGYEVRVTVTGAVAMAPAVLASPNPNPGANPALDEGVLGVMEEYHNDLVTDKDWIFQGSMLAFGMINGLPVARVTAQPNPETGAYELRYLIITPALIKQMRDENLLELWFELEDASLRIPLDAFTGDATREILEDYGLDPDEAVFMLMIAPDADGRELKDGKAYSAGLFVLAGGEAIAFTQLADKTTRLDHSREIDVSEELGGMMDLRPTDATPMESWSGSRVAG